MVDHPWQSLPPLTPEPQEPPTRPSRLSPTTKKRIQTFNRLNGVSCQMRPNGRKKKEPLEKRIEQSLVRQDALRQQAQDDARAQLQAEDDIVSAARDLLDVAAGKTILLPVDDSEPEAPQQPRVISSGKDWQIFQVPVNGVDQCFKTVFREDGTYVTYAV